MLIGKKRLLFKKIFNLSFRYKNDILVAYACCVQESVLYFFLTTAN